MGKQEEDQWQPPWKVHLPIWVVALGASFWLLRETAVGGWAILIFIGIMIVYGGIVGAIQEKKKVSKDQAPDAG